MTTKIQGSLYENNPREDVFDKFDRDATGRVVLTDQGAIERAKIAANHGFIVDPVTGKGFWAMSNWKAPQAIDPTRKYTN